MAGTQNRWSIESRSMDLGAFLQLQLGRDPRADMTAVDWLLTPQQLLLGVVRGAVYHDGIGELDPLRRDLALVSR